MELVREQWEDKQTHPVSVHEYLSDLLYKAIRYDRLGWRRRTLANDVVLHCPDYSLSFVLETDASVRGIGAVLTQSSTTKEDRPLAYFSKKLSLTQQRCTATEKEALAAVTAMEHFSIYLIGRSFTLVTDLSPRYRT